MLNILFLTKIEITPDGRKVDIIHYQLFLILK